MKVAIDSSQASGSIAIHDGKKLVYSAYFDIRITHSETLMPALDGALSICGFSPADIAEIYVCSGPGSFTGLRIGLATAKGMAYGLQAPVYTFNALEMGALACVPYGGNILCVLDAKMHEFYAALYDYSLQELIPPCVVRPQEVLDWPVQGCIVCGSGADILRQIAAEQQLALVYANSLLNIPRAESLFVLHEYRKPTIYHADTLADLEPLYLRESTAQIKAQEKR